MRSGVQAPPTYQPNLRCVIKDRLAPADGMKVSNDTDVVATGADVTGVQSTPDAATKSFSAVTDQEAAIRAGIELSKMAPALMQIGCSLHLKWGMFMRASRISVPPDHNAPAPHPAPLPRFGLPLLVTTMGSCLGAHHRVRPNSVPSGARREMELSNAVRGRAVGVPIRGPHPA